MTHEQQLINVLRPVKEELDAGRLFEAQQIARWLGPDVANLQRRAQEHAARIHAAIDAEFDRIGDKA